MSCNTPKVYVESDALNDFAANYRGGPPPLARRLDLNRGELKNGLGQLVLTLVKLLHELLERQAVRRMEAESLTEEEVERVGLALMSQAEEIERLRKAFGLEDEDLNVDLGPLGTLL